MRVGTILLLKELSPHVSVGQHDLPSWSVLLMVKSIASVHCTQYRQSVVFISLQLNYDLLYIVCISVIVNLKPLVIKFCVSVGTVTVVPTPVYFYFMCCLIVIYYLHSFSFVSLLSCVKGVNARECLSSPFGYRYPTNW